MLMSAWPLDQFAFANFADNMCGTKSPDFEAGTELRLRPDAKQTLLDFAQCLAADQGSHDNLSWYARYECQLIAETTSLPANTLTLVRDRFGDDNQRYVLSGSQLSPGDHLTIASTRPPVSRNDAIGLPRGTMIPTPHGEMPVECLEPGEEILCDSGAFSISGVKLTRIGVIETMLCPAAQAVIVSNNALAPRVPLWDTVLMPGQRIVLQTNQADTAPLVAPKHVPVSDLMTGTSVRYQPPRISSDYFHIACDHSLTVSINGLTVLLPAQKSLPTPVRNRGTHMAETDFEVAEPFPRTAVLN